MPLPPMRMKALACTAGLGWRGGAEGLGLACSTVEGLGLELVGLEVRGSPAARPS